MKEMTKQYNIRECSVNKASYMMFSYDYTFSNNRQEILLGSPLAVIDYSKAYWVFPTYQMYTPERAVRSKYDYKH